MSDSLQKCFSEARLNGLTLRNRLIKAATFEGRSEGGHVSPELVRLHERIGEGGIGMTTLAYCAAESDGRINENQLYMHEGIRGELEVFAARLHATGAKVSGQLGHCGNFSKNREFQGKRPLGPSRGINSLGLAYGLPFVGALSQTQIRERVQVMARGAAFMKSAGLRRPPVITSVIFSTSEMSRCLRARARAGIVGTEILSRKIMGAAPVPPPRPSRMM